VRPQRRRHTTTTTRILLLRLACLRLRLRCSLCFRRLELLLRLRGLVWLCAPCVTGAGGGGAGCGAGTVFSVELGGGLGSRALLTGSFPPPVPASHFTCPASRMPSIPRKDPRRLSYYQSSRPRLSLSLPISPFEALTPLSLPQRR
jgi:hypothetical protein